MKKIFTAKLTLCTLGYGTLFACAKVDKENVMKDKVYYNQAYSNIKIAAELYKPADFNSNKKYPAIIVVHPAGGVKERVAGLYAQNLAKNGFVTLAFDASYQGVSGGEPRFLENPASRVEDVRSAVDYLTTLSFVDVDNIGVLGICAGGGYAFNAAQTEMRIKAVVTVSAFDLGRARRQGLGDSMTLDERLAKLKQAAQQRTKEADGESVKYSGYVPNSYDEIPENAPAMYRQGYEYYRVSKAKHPRSQNKYIFSNYARQAAFSAFDRPELLSSRLVLFIVEEKAESAYFSKEAYDKLSGEKEYVIIPNVTHVEMYYVPEYVDAAVEKLTQFYAKNLNLRSSNS